MKIYKVYFSRIVEADNEQEAKEKAIEDSNMPDLLEIESELEVEELEK